ncbi:uncharacterized protein TNCV_227651 [Trichonephila clavipes]|nr:uncharacterized protein TNCV_227651 [Trichonephila clavipes]
MVELLDDWNGDVPSWKYPRNLESPRVSSPSFGNDSKMMLLPKQTDEAQHQTCLASSLQLPVRQFQGRPCTDALVYMLVELSDVFHLPQLTVACD